MKIVDLKLPDNIVGMILGLDHNGTVVFCSKAVLEKLGYEKTDDVSIYRLFPTFIGKTMEQIITSLNLQEEYPAYRRNETCLFVRVVIRKYSKKIEYLCSLRDYRQQKELRKEVAQSERKLREALEIKNKLVANTTHELRTPLNGIKGQVSYVMEQTEINEEQRRTLQIVMQCCENMEKIINDLLDFSKLEAHKIQLEKLPFSVRELISHIVDTNVKQANKKGIQLSAHVSETIPEILYGDKLRLGQVLNNFVSNGVKFTSFGSVRIEAAELSHVGNRMELIFLVIDTGIGIAPENRDKLFKSFSQVDGSISRQYGGTGLGLVVAKELVSMMGGMIHVESELGNGSTFAFTVVLYTDDKPETEVKSSMIPDFTRLISKQVKPVNSLIYQWDTEENKEERKQVMEKLVLSIEIMNWERAEIFAEKLKELSQGAVQEIKTMIFKMEIAIRKEDHDKSLTEFNDLKCRINKQQENHDGK